MSTSITNEQCNEILRNYFGNNNYKLIDYSIRSASEASSGFLSISSTLTVKVSLNNDINDIKFFIKFLPKDEYQRNVAIKGKSFKKEAAFFGTLFSDMRKFLTYKTIPGCYLKDNETVIVFEHLIANGYKNCSAYNFDLKHVYKSIKSLADLHSASLLYEHKIGKTLDEVFPYDILLCWFCEVEDHPGYQENLAAAGTVSLIIDKYFQNYPENLLNKAKLLCKKFSHFTENKSKKYRNVFTHHDLWCNNIMFKYDENDIVEDAVLIDFQTYGYNPPTLDLLFLIYCNLEKNIRNEHFHELLDYYYKCLSDNIKNHSVNPDDILTKEEFMSSLEETQPIALTGAALFLHTAVMPENELAPIVSDPNRIREYLEKERPLVLDVMEKYEDYRNRVLQSIEDLIEVIKK
ncbi:hypothetical protein O3M35_003470 [Rhynocoris fuscipes]|uniref:CHK kinase-like domain-containing protein n=1 Tax=Rhynocoris fuscipes TaxID=488301 RepID=A0AAW1CKH0_9HEMI